MRLFGRSFKDKGMPLDKELFGSGNLTEQICFSNLQLSSS